MFFARLINEYRATVLFLIISSLSIVSLGFGAEGSVVSRGVQSFVGIATYPFLSAMDSVQDGATYVTDLVFDYDAAIARANKLERQRAAQLDEAAALSELRAENERLRALHDFRAANPRLDIVTAQVIQHAQGTLTIDKGARDGLRPSMCVISPDGVVGLLTQVGPLSANVVTLQNPDCRIDAMFDRNRIRGRVHGSGNDLSAICRIHYIDVNARVREGDRIVTSPDSVFPAGYPIGHVVNTPYQGPLSQSAELIPTVDPFALDEVFVLVDFDRDPLLESESPPVVDAAPAAPANGLSDVQTLQERYAP